MFAGRAMFGPRGQRDAGSMPIAMLITLVGVTLSAGLTTMVVGQLRDSRWSADRTAAVAASEAGLDAGLASIRATGGDYTKLPCATATGSLTGLAGTSTAAAPTYSVSFGYFLVDPSGMVGDLASIGDLTNISSTTSGAVTCVGGKLPRLPLYALLRSVGRVGGSTRTLYATYPFKISGIVSPGGHVVIIGSGGKYCLGGGNAPPVEGDPVLAVLCTSADQQTRVNYQSNNSLVLTLSRNTTAYPNGLCVTVARQANNVAATFQQCAATSSPNQQWSYDVTTQTIYAGTFSSGLCLNAESSGQELSPIVLKNGSDCGTPGVSGKAMVPEAGVGAGGIAKIGQFNNYGAVGRCLDFGSNASPSSTILLVPCQPILSVGSSQYWIGPTILSGTYSAKAPIYVPVSPGDKNSDAYCLKSPSQIGGNVKLAPCNSKTTPLLWTVYDAAPRSAEAYRIMDEDGKCLQAAGGTNSDPSTWTQVTTGVCDSSAVQKWNVPVGGSSGVGPFKAIQER